MTEAKTNELHTQWYAKQLEWESNILHTFRRATADQIVEGKRWYPEAKNRLMELQAGTPFSIEQVTAICAILSPRISWKSNVEGTRRILTQAWSGIVPTVAGVRHNVNKAWSIAQGGSLDLVSGPKVSNFWANLKGDYSRVTVDVWAARAAGLPDSDATLLKGHRYAYVEKAYQAVAKELGFEPAELQAICWIVVRGTGK